MENGPFIDDFPSYKPPFIYGIFHGYVSHNQMVIISKRFFPTFFRQPHCKPTSREHRTARADAFRIVPRENQISRSGYPRSNIHTLCLCQNSYPLVNIPKTMENHHF